MEELLFISDKKFTDFTIPGGVQLCTTEFLQYFKLAGFNPAIIKLDTTRSFSKKLRIKFGIEVYDRYDFEKYTDEIISQINNKKLKLVAFNQLNLSPLVKYVKPRVSNEVKFIGLSHGNESGDFLHDITRGRKPSLIETWKLGKQLVSENDIFVNLLDGIVVIADNELAINQWVGAEKQLYLPRILEDHFVSWTPTGDKAGFVGTLDHLPNKIGIQLLCNALQKINFDKKIRIAGAPVEEGKALETKYSFVEYLGRLSEDALVKEVSNWSLFLNPVFWYSRGSSTKLAQALNWGLPTLTTPAGKRGYEIINAKIVTADNRPETFAQSLMDVLSNNDQLQCLKNASVDNVRRFDVSIWGKQLRNFVNSLHR